MRYRFVVATLGVLSAICAVSAIIMLVLTHKGDARVVPWAMLWSSGVIWFLLLIWWMDHSGTASYPEQSAFRWPQPLRIRCTRRGVFGSTCAVLTISMIGGTAGAALAGGAMGLLVGALGSRKLQLWLAVVGTVVAGLLGHAGLWESTLQFILVGASLAVTAFFALCVAISILICNVLFGRWSLRALGLVDLDPERQPEVLSRLQVLLPPEEAKLWLRSNLGYLADIADGRERRRFLRSLTLHMPLLVWTSWSIHLRRGARRRHVLIEGVRADATEIEAAILALPRRNYREFRRGHPVSVRVRSGRLLTVRYSALEGVTRAESA